MLKSVLVIISLIVGYFALKDISQAAYLTVVLKEKGGGLAELCEAGILSIKALIQTLVIIALWLMDIAYLLGGKSEEQPDVLGQGSERTET